MEDHPHVRAFVSAMLIIAAVSAYFAAPILRFVNPVPLATFGLMLGVGAGGSWVAIRSDWGWKWLVPTAVLGLVGLLLIALFITDAFVASEKNDERCAAIQHDMLSASPRRSDGAALFEALACRPRGNESVSFKAPARPTTRQSSPTDL